MFCWAMATRLLTFMVAAPRLARIICLSSRAGRTSVAKSWRIREMAALL